MERETELLAQLKPQLHLETIKDVSIEKVRYHLSVKPFGCGLWLWRTHDKIKTFAASYAPPQGGTFSLEQFWKDYKDVHRPIEEP